MVRDYSTRRQVNKNRPKNRRLGLLTVAVMGAFVAIFGIGFVSGWMVGKRADRASLIAARKEAASAQQAAAQATPAAATGVAGGVEPALTFYQTLPKGGKAVIGTGINPSRPGDQGLPAHVPDVPTLEKPPVPEAVAAPKKEEKKAPEALPAPPAKDAGTYTVQVASSQNRREADAMRDTLVAKGLPAHVVESRVKDKGVWYRVRVGKGFDRKQAGDIAAKAGNGAIVIPE